MRRLTRWLRSRKLAVGLLLGLTAFSFVGTLLPQGAATDPDVAAWDAARPGIASVVSALGLHDVFSHPLFIAAAVLLALSTIACSWERTRVAAKAWARSTTMPEQMPERLVERPMRVVEAPAGLDVPGAADAATAALRRLGLRTEAVREGVLHVVAGRVGLVGSPLFHWSLAALILVVGAGQLSRSEGMIGVPLGVTVPLTAEEYGTLRRGPLYVEPRGLSISATDLRLDFREADGVPRGEAAVVTLERDGAPAASGRVYPNSPLHLGTMVVHQAEYGLSPVIRVLATDGTELGVARPLVDFAGVGENGEAPGAFDLSSPALSGQSLQVAVSVPLQREDDGFALRRPDHPAVRVAVSQMGSAMASGTLIPGASLSVPGLGSLQLVDVAYYTRLTIVDDWSVYPIYALFVLATIGLALAMLLPYREVWLLAVPDGAGARYHLIARHGRDDPAFADRVESALRNDPGEGGDR